MLTLSISGSIDVSVNLIRRLDNAATMFLSYQEASDDGLMAGCLLPEPSRPPRASRHHALQLRFCLGAT